MIQIYDKNNTNYNMNGDSVLEPTVCEVDAELNGAWEMSIEHPIDKEGRWKHIEGGAVVSATTFMGKEQLFRIYQKTKSDTGIAASARPIFMDAAGEVFLVDKRPTVKNGQGALNEMLAGQSKYNGASDIAKTSTAYYVRKNLIEALQSDEEQSFLNRWGGEITYNNYQISINKRAGGEYGARAELGHNCTAVEEDINMENIVTRIVPIAYNGHTLGGDAPWVDSKNINKYPVKYTKTIEFPEVKLTEDAQEDEQSFRTLELLRAELVRKCNEQYENGIDLPCCNYKCDVVELSGTDEYEDIKELEQIGFGDTVICKNKRIEIQTEARVVKVVYDCIMKKNKNVELGDFTYDYLKELTTKADRIDDITDDKGNLVAERIRGIIDGMDASLRVQSTVAKKSRHRAVLFEDLDPDSELHGAMALGTQGFEIANTRTEDGKSWKWETFGTAQGFYATYLIAGILSSRNWIKDTMGFNLDLDHGTINSKHLKLDDTGLLKLYSAVIEGGSFKIEYKNQYGYNDPLFIVNKDGIGLGQYAQGLMYRSGESFMTLSSEIKILSGKLLGYATNGNKGVEMSNTNINFYAWNDAGNYVGCVRSFKKIDDTKRIGVEMLCDAGDILSLGIANGPNGNSTAVFEIDGNKPDSVPFMRGTASGTIKIADATSPGRNHELYVDNGSITGWHTYEY